jgi:UDP-2,3-diacylglucosamine hydrolase
MHATPLDIQLQAGKKLYFASDFHLGAPNHAESLLRERKIVAWLDAIKTDAQVIFLVGDMFDFWFEYRRVVPRGFVRLLGKLAELADAGVEIVVFRGNHDLWMTDYFEQELNVKVCRRPLLCNVQSEGQTKTFYVVHGDGLGPGDYLYKVLCAVFENSVARWCFGNLLPADVAMWLAHAWARNSWQKHQKQAKPAFWGEDKEWLLLHAKAVEQQQHHDFYVFGHRHIELDHPVAAHSRMFILGDWITLWTYAHYDGTTMQLTNF